MRCCPTAGILLMIAAGGCFADLGPMTGAGGITTATTVTSSGSQTTSTSTAATTGAPPGTDTDTGTGTGTGTTTTTGAPVTSTTGTGSATSTGGPDSASDTTSTSTTTTGDTTTDPSAGSRTSDDSSTTFDPYTKEECLADLQGVFCIDCICEYCGSLGAHCYLTPGCFASFDCFRTTGCPKLDCDEACANVINQYGGMVGLASNLAFAMMTCTDPFCPQC